MKVLDEFLKPQATALSLRRQRMEILGSNIANAATPNFKARDIDFEAEYKQALGTGGKLATTHVQHASLGNAAVGNEALYRLPMSPSLDGNTVELHVEQVQFAENAVRYEMSLQFLSDRMNGLRKALRGE
jgi:flagellar basal-body rod protein FlgB